MFKRTRRTVKRLIRFVIVGLCLLTSALLVVLVVPWHLTPHVQSDQVYATWMSEHLDPATRLVDVGMLGAHDAFAANMGLFSPLDPAAMASGYTHALLAPPLGWLAKGFMIRQSNTQVADATTLLQRGIRYFDIRLSRDEAWSITHNYLAPESVTTIFEALADFLHEHPGEVLILDFQWVFDLAADDSFADAATFEALLVLLDETGLMPFVVPAATTDLSTVTYGEIVAKTGGSAVVLLAKTGDHGVFFNRSMHIRSTWYNTDNYDELWNQILIEATIIEGDPVAMDRFRVMQAVKTLQLSESGILNSLSSWSLINRARLLNARLAEQDALCDTLDALPILMLDFADSNKGEALDRFMACIIERAS
ncbi:MAG: hypothetical protein EA374_02355 [Acholeplasmatales bacterium]|nr:MAG: hypothetical protein EA374_02355 [Acholeplasmatales bacterium]